MAQSHISPERSLVPPWWVWIGLGTISFFLFLGLGIFGIVPVPVGLDLDIAWSHETRTTQYIPTYVPNNGKELVFVYIGSSTCGFSNDESLPALIERVKVELHRKAQAHGLDFSAVGVAIDWHVPHGIKHLEKFGLFNEIMTGENWQGTGARQHFGGSLSGESSTPQVLAYVRSIQGGGVERSDQYYHESDKHLLARKIGLDGISQWAELGLPMPTDILSLDS